jgi:uncharacterized protein (DUF924 family)
MDHREVLNFWFSELEESDWYKKDQELDSLIKKRFLVTYHQAARGELYPWRDSMEGRLAEIIVLDQFSRNMFRDNPQAFSCDCIAVILAQEAAARPEHMELPARMRSFLYMPLMHSESLVIHERAVELFSSPGLEGSLEYEYKHKRIIEQFGRYPHRNKVLGRKSTEEEIRFLTQPGSSF